MKPLYILLLCFLTGAAGVARSQNAPAVQQNTGGGVLKFETMTHDFGEVAEGPTVSHDFAFKNTGTQPVIIQTAMGSCGCTRATFPREPIKPGAIGMIHVMYDTENRPGPIAKIVTIISNAAQPTIILHIKGTVTKPNVPPAASVH